MFANTPTPPYFVVCFTSKLSDIATGYDQMADKMVEMAMRQDGYLGHETTRGSDGLGITLSYWRDETAIKAWRDVSEHQFAQKIGREKWYERFVVRVAKVERDYGS